MQGVMRMQAVTTASTLTLDMATLHGCRSVLGLEGLVVCAAMPLPSLSSSQVSQGVPALSACSAHC
jgi:hypothetical protein